jgi:hypothetical protein
MGIYPPPKLGQLRRRDVRFGSIATDPFRVSAEQCPLRSESD